MDGLAILRVDQLRAPDGTERADGAYLYGVPGAPGATGSLAHLNAFFLLTERPEVYNLPPAPTRASNRTMPSLLAGLAAVAGLALAAFATFSNGGR